VNEKYYINAEILSKYIRHGKVKNYKERFGSDGCNVVSDNSLQKVGCLTNDSQANRVYDSNNISSTLVGLGGGLGAKTGLYLDDTLVKTGQLIDRRNQDGRVYDSNAISRTLLANGGGISGCGGLYEEQLSIRKLTPRECYRLQGFDDCYFDRVKKHGISDTSLYKQAGNSITVNVLYFIFKNLFGNVELDNEWFS